MGSEGAIEIWSGRVYGILPFFRLRIDMGLQYTDMLYSHATSREWLIKRLMKLKGADVIIILRKIAEFGFVGGWNSLFAANTKAPT
jgi:hypothetical protein